MKRILNITKIVMLLFLLCHVNIESLAYSDVPKDYWAYNCISKLSDISLLSGYQDNSFKPDNNITRAEFIMILMKTKYPDIDVLSDTGYWADKAITLAQNKNILNISEYNEFDPSKDITRWEICKMLYRCIDNAEQFNLDKITEKKWFLDIEVNNIEAQRIIQLLSYANILSGYPDGRCRLDNFSTRAETCCFINNYMENKEKLNDLLEENPIVYEGDIAVISKNKLPYELKGKKNGKDIPYVTTKIKDIKSFKFGEDVPNEYTDSFEKLYAQDNLYSKYRVKLGEDQYVIAVDIETKNNTKDYDIFVGHEFLHISFPDQDIKVIDSFDEDEIKRQIEKNADIGQKILPGKTLSTSVFYVVNMLPTEKIRIDRDITSLFDNKTNENKNVDSFHSIIIKDIGG